MYKVDLPADQSTDEVIERRRAAEATRKTRIFNTRSRVIGLDIHVLDQQVNEKKQRQSMEEQRDKAFDNMRMSHDKTLLQQEKDEMERRATLDRDLTQYWGIHQRVEDSRDADLKCDLKRAIRLTIPEAELGPASMHFFQGEGVGEEQKKRAQKERTKNDLLAQKEDNEKRHSENKKKELLIDKELVHQDLRAVQLDVLEVECKKAMHFALNNYNRALTDEQSQKLREQHKREEGEGLAEMWYMLTECPEAAEREVGRVCPPRILTDRWKGMSPEQLSAIHKEREKQCLERQRQRETEKIQDAEWNFRLMEMARRAEEKEKEATKLQRERRIQQDGYNKQLARQQQAHQEYLIKKLYTNKPNADYFNQFNTSSR
ncbi:RIB43A-like with coiled-coils protein 1 [Lampris incognitus]|uniref:RIB43A-like with coiled-coils protein 1 n=1 Tax=Lampris incognitus TaxID=2546036 RepID=UPI0024B61FB6|nr:RIB43A-like with coiled-coils protein 1 [Lampris incognitus]